MLTNPGANGGMGTTKNVSGIAVNQDTIFVSSAQDDKIFCIDKASGKQVRIIENVKAPQGLAFGLRGRLYVVSDKEIITMNPDGSDRGTLVPWYEVAAPRRIAVAKNGDCFVTVQGRYHQVMHFDANGKFLNAIGREGGLPVPGPWDQHAMRRPLGIAIAPDGKLWVTEETMNPKRTSVWEPTGAFVTDYIGPVPYASTCVMDPERPQYIYSENTEFLLDYHTGKARPSAVVYDDGDRGQVGPVYGSWEARFIHFQGRTFLMRAQGSLSELKNGRLIPRVSFPSVPGITHNPYWVNNIMLAIDRNEDGKFDSAEMQHAMLDGGNGWLGWVADNLDMYLGDWNSFWKLPFEGFDARGVPNYDMTHVKLLMATDDKLLAAHPGAKPFPVPGHPDAWMVDSEGNYYFTMTTGEGRIKRGQGYLDKGHRLVKLSPRLDVLWEYRNLVVGMGACWNTSISKPGEVLGTMRFTGEFGRYLTLGTYFGQYHIFDKDTGLYITSFTPDTRSEPPLDGMAVFTENFNGCALYARALKKYLYCGGDCQARVWEVQGLDAVKYAAAPLSVSEQQHAQAVAAARVEYGVSSLEKAEHVAMAPMQTPRIDGELTDWQHADWVNFGVDERRKGRAAVCWSANTLHVAFDITDDSPMLNRGGNPNLLFKTGDAVEFDLSSTDAEVARADESPLAGDQRILISFVKDAQGNEHPLAMLYEPKSARADKSPATFTSPVSSVTYDYVAPLPATIAIKRTAHGYTLTASFEAGRLGFTALEVGQRIRADFGALFSDAGGTMVLAKAMWADDSPEVSVVNDIPTEAKIHPKHWGWLVLR